MSSCQVCGKYHPDSFVYRGFRRGWHEMGPANRSKEWSEDRRVVALERAASAGRLALVDELVRRGRAWIAAPAGAVIPADAESLADLATALLALLAYDDQHEPPAPTIDSVKIGEKS